MLIPQELQLSQNFGLDLDTDELSFGFHYIF